MILTLSDQTPFWQAHPTFPDRLFIRASRIAGSKPLFLRVEDGQPGQDPLWQVQVPRADLMASATDEPLYGTFHMLVGTPSQRVVLVGPSDHQNMWSVHINGQAVLWLPDFNPMV